MRAVVCLLAFVLAIFSGSALAGLPCSGSRGGVARCEGDSFVCADGAVSQSKKSCQASEYANVAPGAVASESGAVANAPVKASYAIIGAVGVMGVFIWVVEAVVILLVGLVLHGVFPKGSKFDRVPSFVCNAAAGFVIISGGWFFGGTGFSVWGHC